VRTARTTQDEPADALFYVQKGRVKVTVVSEQGKEAVVATLVSNDFFGEGCPRRTAEARVDFASGPGGTTLSVIHS
jgi:CRP-like cAMP-binding protein